MIVHHNNTDDRSIKPFSDMHENTCLYTKSLKKAIYIQFKDQILLYGSLHICMGESISHKTLHVD